MSFSKLAGAVAGVLAMIMVFAGCEKPSGPSPTASPEPRTQTATPEPAATPEPGIVEEEIIVETPAVAQEPLQLADTQFEAVEGEKLLHWRTSGEAIAQATGNAHEGASVVQIIPASTDPALFWQDLNANKIAGGDIVRARASVKIDGPGTAFLRLSYFVEQDGEKVYQEAKSADYPGDGQWHELSTQWTVADDLTGRISGLAFQMRFQDVESAVLLAAPALSVN